VIQSVHYQVSDQDPGRPHPRREGTLSAVGELLQNRRGGTTCVLVCWKARKLGAQTGLVMDNGWTEETGGVSGGDQTVRYEPLAL